MRIRTETPPTALEVARGTMSAAVVTLEGLQARRTELAATEAVA
jgi:hypothetical protein